VVQKGVYFDHFVITCMMTFTSMLIDDSVTVVTKHIQMSVDGYITTNITL